MDGQNSELPADQNGDQRPDVGARGQASPASIPSMSPKTLPVRHRFDTDQQLTSRNHLPSKTYAQGEEYTELESQKQSLTIRSSQDVNAFLDVRTVSGNPNR